MDDIINNSPAVIFVKDTSFRYIMINREYERIFHINQESILGKTDHDFLSKEIAAFFRSCDENAVTGREPVEMEINIPLDDGVHTYFCVKFLLYDAQNVVYGICVIASDISDRIKAEKILKDFNEQLKQEVEQRTIELKRANQTLEQQKIMLKRLAVVDGLTEIPNRRQFDGVLDKEWKRAQRIGAPVALIMIDIDCFKNYKDHYGHACGDDCLRKVARALKQSLGRASDFIARYGGEEFAVILPSGSEESATKIAENMRVNIECLNIPHAASPVSDHVTLSLGIALLTPTRETSPRNLIEMADNALYQAKANGRNQVGK